MAAKTGKQEANYDPTMQKAVVPMLQELKALEDQEKEKNILIIICAGLAGLVLFKKFK